MRLLEGEELEYFKKNYFTAGQKTLCKIFEQKSGSFTFKVDGKPYRYEHDGSKAYTDYIENKKVTHKVGIMGRTTPHAIDKVNKFNHEEYKIHKKIDKNGSFRKK